MAVKKIPMAQAILAELREVGACFDSGDVPWTDCWTSLEGWYNRWILRQRKRRQQGWWVNTKNKINLPTEVLREKMMQVAISAAKHPDCDPVRIYKFYESHHNSNHEPGFWREVRLILRDHPMVPFWALEVHEQDFVRIAQEDLLHQIQEFNHIYCAFLQMNKTPENVEILQILDGMGYNSSFTWVSHRSDMPTLLRLADLFKRVANEKRKNFFQSCKLDPEEYSSETVTLFDQLQESTDGQ